MDVQCRGPAADPSRAVVHKYSWMAEFLAAMRHYETNTIQTVRWAMEARRHLLAMAEEEEGIAFDREARGILHFYANRKDFEVAARVTELLRRGGLHRRAVTRDEISCIEPTLRGDIYGGFYTEDDFTGDIHKFTAGLTEACHRYNVALRFSTKVERLETTADGVRLTTRLDEIGDGTDRQKRIEQFDRVVICAGVKSRALAAMAGDRVNIYPVKGYSITVNLDTEADRSAAPWTSLLDDNAKLVTSRLGASRFRVAGTAEFIGHNKDIVWERIDPMLRWCRRHFPQMSTENFISWAGLRPMMPNMLPRLGQGRHPAVYYNTGHGHLGWTLSAATAEIVSGMVLAGTFRQGHRTGPAAVVKAPLLRA